MKDIEKYYNKAETQNEVEEQLKIDKMNYVNQLSSEDGNERLRIEIIYEFIESENAYIHDLETIVKVFNFSSPLSFFKKPLINVIKAILESS